jgi:hypothetical protein
LTKIILTLVVTLVWTVLAISGSTGVVKTTLGVQAVEYSFPALGPYRIRGQRPRGLRKFREFKWSFKPGEDRQTANITPNGELVVNGSVYAEDGTEYRFQSGSLSSTDRRFNRIVFRTESIKGIGYTFDGTFSPKPVFEDGLYVSLAGTLVKFGDGMTISRADLKFLEWSYQ